MRIAYLFHQSGVGSEMALVRMLSKLYPLLGLDAQQARHAELQPVHYDEAGFRYALNEDAMATEKLAEGIRAFAVDTAKLEQLIRAH